MQSVAEITEQNRETGRDGWAEDSRPPSQDAEATAGHGSEAICESAMLASDQDRATLSSAKPGHLLGTIFSLLVCIPVLCARVKLLLAPLPLFDLITYWTAGRLFLTGGNPYSMQAIFAIERSQGWPYPVPLVMLNPPWTLALAAPLALLPFQIAHHLWFLLSIAIEAACSLALWQYFGGERRLRWISLMVLATYFPAAGAEHFGQITPLVLGAVTVFLFAVRSERYVLAGVCVAVFGVKPHLFYLVFLAVLLWSLQKRKWQIPVTAAASAGTAALAALAFNHNIAGYFHGMVGAALDTRCGIGGTLRSCFGNEHVWLQFVPCVFGMAWFAAYWARHRKTWSWQSQIPLLLLMSIATSAYFWPVDFVLALPALIALAVRVRQSAVLPIAVVLYAAVQLLIVEGGNAAGQCLACLLWVALYWAVMQMAAVQGRAERIVRSPELA
jgi:hypothetical protein